MAVQAGFRLGTITGIDCKHGAPFRSGMSTADKLASEWDPVLGKTHSTVEKADMENEFDKFVRIPEKRKLSMAENDILMAPVTLQEVIDAITALNRHKSAGPDGINNDLFKDAQALLAPAMVAIRNELLQGGTPLSLS
ncbi:hypothetical protein PC121_g6546 [Phytophthora cactorum]|nr:hypothetical protein PC120_g8214 [Phytophthora cactorum]KAG3081196.1 hypothetical protein PC121_g6546 [Phytophthora cactorum]